MFVDSETVWRDQAAADGTRTSIRRDAEWTFANGERWLKSRERSFWQMVARRLRKRWFR
jgi:hypothetical protein